jgi:hypothetical protein
MAARKKSAGRRAPGRFTGPLGLEFELPETLRDYASQLRKRLDRLEAELARARAGMRRRAVRLLREASQQLGRLEAEGEAGWRRLAEPYRRELVALLRRLERALAPPRAARKRPARKAPGRGQA